MSTKIKWTDEVWNVVTGCTKVTSGCANCYAERDFHRPYPGRSFTEVHCHTDRLDQPSRWRRPRRIFACSMGDLFHDSVGDDFIIQVFKAMAHAHWHTFQVLTKRADRMSRLVPKIRYMLPDRLEHVWLGVSVSNQEDADRDIPFLLRMSAAVLFVSYEPALGPVNFRGYLHSGEWPLGCGKYNRIDWVICGGESGPAARPMHPDWARSVRDQCQAAGVPFFFKQWGEWACVEPSTPEKFPCTEKLVSSGNNHAWMRRVGKRAAGRMLDGRTWKEFPA